MSMFADLAPTDSLVCSPWTTGTLSPAGGAPVWPRGAPPVAALHVINGEHFSGAERVQDLLALRLPELGFRVVFACVKPGKFAAARRSDVPLYEAPMRGRWDVRSGNRVGRWAKGEACRLIHAHTPRSLLVAARAARIAGLPLVYHVHSPTLCDSTHRLRNWANHLVERWCLRRASLVIAVSDSLARRMQRQGIGAERLRVVRNGVPAAGRAAPRRRRPDSPWTLGVIALFRPRKGVEVLLQSLAMLRQRGDRVRLLAVGPFETEAYERQVRRMAAELGLDELIEWTGFTRDVGAQLQRMDVFVLPSLFGEGLPMVVLEAMAAGVPVAATCVEGVVEAVRDGLDGVLARPGDPHDLARAIGRIVAGRLDWAALSRSARQRHRQCFSDRAMASGVAAAYRRVLAGRPRASGAQSDCTRHAPRVL